VVHHLKEEDVGIFSLRGKQSFSAFPSKLSPSTESEYMTHPVLHLILALGLSWLCLVKE
jgi:hypothetical protein